MIRSHSTLLTCFSILLACVSEVSAQNIADINYKLDVTLDDVRHEIEGDLELAFTNNTGKALEELYMHLYPNAYSNKETAFARQQLSYGDKKFYFAKDDELGKIDGLQFQIDDSEIPWRLDAQNPDIAILTPLQPILPGQTVHLSTPFVVVIPISFSRLGRVGESYQISQWYPKLAMYDDEGWHPMPYLELGEYYSEFASYDVRIAIPENYIVAATGNLQDKSEQDFLDSLARVENSPIEDFPSSSKTFKTLHFKADDVHDFAWFADKRFAVRKRVTVLDGHTINCWAFFTAMYQENWSKGTEYVESSLRFYSDQVGPYPYDNITAVEAPLSNGGGMEYPMITLIGMAPLDITLDRVITHEVGHNWFYGMIATDERRYAWMDEGINYYFENRYILEKYGDLKGQFLIHLGKRDADISDNQLMLHYQSRLNRLQSPETLASESTYNNYFYDVYTKPAYAFLMLEKYMGREKFDAAVKKYYADWSFKHPDPDDLRLIFEKECNCDLTWLFEGLLTTADLIDYKLDDYNLSDNQLKLTNKGSIEAPVEIVGSKEGKQITRKWIEGISGAQTVTFECLECDKVQLYDSEYTLDETPQNNIMHINGAKTNRRKFRVTMLSGVPDPAYDMVNILPLFGWNQYDKAMFGVNISNMYWPVRNLEWSVTPLYAIGTNNLTGLGSLRYSIYPKARREGSKLYKWEFGFEAKSFHYNYDEHYDFSDRYVKLAPSVKVVFRPSSALSKLEHSLSYRFIHIGQRYGKGTNYDDFIWEWESRGYDVNELSYEIRNKSVLAPYKIKATVHQGKGFVRLSADFRQKIAYPKGNKGLYIHGFAGWLPYYDDPDAVALFYFNGISSRGFFSKDFLYDELIFGRSEGENILSQQTFRKDAEIKTLYNIGLSDNWMISAGLATDTPLPIPIQLYFDVAAYKDPINGGVAVSFSSGIGIVGIKDAFEIFIPVFESSDIRGSTIYEDRGFFRRVTFLIDLNAANPRRLMEGILE
jgi:Peptidase family M1 domain